MAVALSPWPVIGVNDVTEPDWRDAVKRLQGAVAGRALDSEAEADSLGAVASALVEQYAPNAPQTLRDEAVIRFAGALAQSDFGTISQESIGTRSVTYTTNHASAFRYSGAAMLLSKWRVRRAGAIG